MSDIPNQLRAEKVGGFPHQTIVLSDPDQVLAREAACSMGWKDRMGGVILDGEIEPGVKREAYRRGWHAAGRKLEGTEK